LFALIRDVENNYSTMYARQAGRRRQYPAKNQGKDKRGGGINELIANKLITYLSTKKFNII